MKPIRLLAAAPVLLIMTCSLFTVCGDRTQKVSDADLRREKYKFESVMAAKLVVYRRSLHQMNARAENASSQFKLGTDRQSAELERQLEAAEKNLTALDASSKQDWIDMKPGLEHAFDDLGKSFEQATARFNHTLVH